MNTGLYIHVPFCRKKCDYCSFYSIAAGEKYSNAVPDNYVESVIREIEQRLIYERPVSIDTIYFGGGTPSLLSYHQVSRITGAIHSSAQVMDNAEVTLEVNPEDLDHDTLTGYIDAGVNRLILGVQTLSETHHEFIGRSGKLCSVNDIELFFGLQNVEQCIDLMTGIPGQSQEDILNDIHTVTVFNPHHISAYLLSVETATPLGARYTGDAGFNSFQGEVFYLIAKELKLRGYEHYEISNYAKKGHESRHNMKYWTFDPYIGIGPGSHSFINGERLINRMTVEEYINADKPLLYSDQRNSNDTLIEFILTGLRLINGFSLDDMEHQLNMNIPDVVFQSIRRLIDQGDIVMEDSCSRGRIRIPEDKLIVSDRIIYDLVEELIAQ